MEKPIVGKIYNYYTNEVEILGYGRGNITGFDAIFFKSIKTGRCGVEDTIGGYCNFKPIPEPLQIGQEVWIKTIVNRIYSRNGEVGTKWEGIPLGIPNGLASSDGLIYSKPR